LKGAGGQNDKQKRSSKKGLGDHEEKIPEWGIGSESLGNQTVEQNNGNGPE